MHAQSIKKQHSGESPLNRCCCRHDDGRPERKHARRGRRRRAVISAGDSGRSRSGTTLRFAVSFDYRLIAGPSPLWGQWKNLFKQTLLKFLSLGEMNGWIEMIRFFPWNEYSACVTSLRHLRGFMKAVSDTSELSRAEPPDFLLCSPYCSIHNGCRVRFITVGNNEDMMLHSYSVIQSMSLCRLMCNSVFRKSFWTRVVGHNGTRNGSVRGLHVLVGHEDPSD